MAELTLKSAAESAKSTAIPLIDDTYDADFDLPVKITTYKLQSESDNCKEYVFEDHPIFLNSTDGANNTSNTTASLPITARRIHQNAPMSEKIRPINSKYINKLIKKEAFRKVLALPIICAALLITGAAALIALLSRSSPAAPEIFALERRTYDAYNIAFEFIEYEFPLAISVGNNEVEVITSQTTVGELLDESGIVLGEHDSVNLPLDHVVSDEDEIEITRVNYKTITKERTLPYGKKTIDSQNIPRGTTSLESAGENGKAVDTYEQRFENGAVIDEVLISTKTLQPPVDEVYKKGVGGTFTAPDGKTYKYSYYLDVSATAYGDVSEGKNPNWHGITAIGVPCRPGIIGVDPNTIPFRSNVYVTGNYGDFGVCYAADTGNITGNYIDIYMEKYADMVNFGRRKMRAYILE